jgi:NADH:ubiquinone oxidoreductase subunit 4 (subunit M)
MANLLLLLLVSPFAGALLIAVLAARPRPLELSQAVAAENAQLQRSAWIAAAAAGLSALALLALASDVIAGTPARARWPWLPALGVGFGLRLDGLALLFCGLIVGIGLLVVSTGICCQSQCVRVVEVLVELLEHDTRVGKLLDCHRTPQPRPTRPQPIAVSVQPC